jgi:hypothetical protein
MPATVCKWRGAAAAVVAVAVAAEVAGVAEVAVVAAAAAEAAVRRGVFAASAKSEARPYPSKRETLWPGQTKSTRPIHVIFMALCFRRGVGQISKAMVPSSIEKC